MSLWGTYSCDVWLRRHADAHALHVGMASANFIGCNPGNRARCHAEVFSFHTTKGLTAPEGGVIATDHDALAEKLRQMVSFGVSGEDRVVDLGANAKMSEGSATIGLTLSKSRAAIYARSRGNYPAYCEGLKDVPDPSVLADATNGRHTLQYIAAETDEDAMGWSRNEKVAARRLENVQTRGTFVPDCPRKEPYRTLFPQADAQLARTEAVAARVIVFSHSFDVSPGDVAQPPRREAQTVAGAPQVKAALAISGDPRLPEFLT